MPRMISPTGELGQVPQEQVEAALQEGFKVMTDEDMANMHNRQFLAQKFFEQKHPKITNWRLPRGRGRW
jgi:hypothetical protein